MARVRLEPENEQPGIIKDHEYVPRHMDEPWGVCVCGLAEAAHLEVGEAYKVPEGTPFRCPDCVMTDQEVCNHR